jgi:hypothetical protein
MVALSLVVTIGGLLGPAATPAQAQGALGAAGTAGYRVTRPTWTPAAPAQVRRYYTYDPAARRYFYYDVPVRRPYSYDARTRRYYDYAPASRVTYSYTYPTPYPAGVRRPGPGMFNGPRRAAGIGAQGADGRANPDEWIGR